MNVVAEITNRFAQKQLYNGASPIQRLGKLERVIDASVEIYIKRDDLLRPFFGNKIRYLEFILGLYEASKADCIIHAGGLTSNYMSQVAMAGAREGIPVYLILRREEPDVLQGNPLLEEIYGAKVYYNSESLGPTNSEIKGKLANELRQKGYNPFVIDYPISNYYAYLGYMKCYLEIKSQIETKELPPIDHIYLCSGWHSYLGLQIAADLFNDDISITAVRPCYWKGAGLDSLYPDFYQFLQEKVREFAEFLNVPLPTKNFNTTEDYVGQGYGVADDKALSTVCLLARTEDILLDPVYSGKAMSGLIDHITNNRIKGESRVLFIHTGGWANIFAYNKEFTDFFRKQRAFNNGCALE